MSIAFVDLAAQFSRLEAEIRAAIDRVLKHGKFILGPEVSELEERLAAFAGVEHAVTCSSGTDALLMSLIAYDVGPGDAVFTTPFTFIATAEVISLIGATPVFVDIDPRTFNIDPALFETAVERIEAEGRLHLRGVIPVDLFGLPADYDALRQVTEGRDLFILEDAAQSFGALYKGRRAGALGDVAATSFFPAKPLGCYGDGGAVLTDDDALAARLESIRVHGKGTDKYDNVRIGLNARMDTLQAAIVLAKLQAFAEELEARQRVAERYTRGLSAVVETPWVPDGLTSAYAQYSILSEQRANIMAALKAEHIPSAIYYAKPLHLQGAFANLGHQEGDFPVAERTSQRIFSLPMHPYLRDDEMGGIVNVIIQTVN